MNGTELGLLLFASIWGIIGIGLLIGHILDRRTNEKKVC